MKLSLYFFSIINRLAGKDKNGLPEQRALKILEQAQSLENDGRPEEALSQYDEAIRLKPGLARAHALKGNLLAEMEKHEEAKAAYQTAVECDPDYAAAHFNLGDTFYQLGLYDKALESLRMALLKKPDFVEAEITMGCVLHDQGKIEEAISCYHRALVIQPGHSGAHQNLGCALAAHRKYEEAVPHYQAALAVNPDLVEVENNLGNALHESGQCDEAINIFRRVLIKKPDLTTAHNNLLFALSHSPAVTPEILFAEHCRFGDQIESTQLKLWPRHRNDMNPERKLRVGLISADFNRHAMANFIEPLVRALLNHVDIELHAYYTRSISDDRTNRFRQIILHWHPVVQLSDDALENLIRKDEIDILIDASGHSSGNRLTCLARKPAPIQAGWLGYLGTTGLRAMDYYLCDANFLPQADFGWQFTEKLIHLPATGAFLQEDNLPPINRLPALDNGFITFGSFNRGSKLNHEVIALWSLLLKAVPEARMLFGAMSGPQEIGRIITAFAAEGIASERLCFHQRTPISEYLSLHHEVDLCLDTFPFAGGTTLLHAISMGVPTLTIAGRTPAGRFGASLLSHLSLANEFVASDPAEFIHKGKYWAHSLDALEDIRVNLRQRFQDSILNQPERIAASWVLALRLMWKHWCAELPAESIDISQPVDSIIHNSQASHSIAKTGSAK